MRKYLGILTLVLAASAAGAQEISTAPVQVNLLLQTNFAAQEKTPAAFSVKRAEIVLSGDASPQLGYLVNYDPANYNGLKDARMRYAFRPELAVAAGRFKYPQGLEGRTPSGQLLFIERSDLGNTFGDQRAYGLEIGGRAGVLEYAAAAINDWSSSRTWAARLGIRDGPFVLGASGLYGPTYRGRQWRVGLEGRIQVSSWTCQSEIGYGENDNYDREYQSRGAYAALARKIGQFRPAARLEFWGSDPPAGPVLAVVGRLTVGSDWFLTGDETKGSKLSLNVRTNNVLLVQWQVVW